ncbi:hypothetical protein [Mucilaginibacter sp. HD30]
MKNFKKTFNNRAELCTLVERYFKYIEGEYRIEKTAAKKADEEPTIRKITIRDAEPATIAALVLHLGFNSREEFEALEEKGRYAAILKRARLQVEAAYEKRLLQPSPSGAMFALKNLGWYEKADTEKAVNGVSKKLTIEVIETGHKPVSDENEVILD